MPRSSLIRDDRRRLVVSTDGDRIEGILVTALSSPTCYTDEPTTATLRVYIRNLATGRKEETTQTIEITNFDPTLDGPAGAVCKVEWKEGCWQPYYVGCEDALADCASSSGTEA